MNKQELHTTRKTKRRNASAGTVEYVIPLGNGWIVKNSRASKFTVITDSKREAIVIARSIAKQKHGELIVHGKNGEVEKTEKY